MYEAATLNGVEVSDLIRACDGCRTRCEVASTCVGNPALRRLLSERAALWERLTVAVCEQYAVGYDRSEDTSARILSALHRAMIKVKSALNNDRAIAVSCADQEMSALQTTQDWMEAEQTENVTIQECLLALAFTDLARFDITL